MTLTKWTRPSNYIGASWFDYYRSGFGQHRDSPALERSNFEVAWEALSALNTDLEGESTVQRVSENHWAVGWVEWIAIHESNTAAIKLAEELLAKLEQYPILDEMHFSNLECEEKSAYWDRCSMRERIRMCERAGESIFAARRDIMPDRVYERIEV